MIPPHLAYDPKVIPTGGAPQQEVMPMLSAPIRNVPVCYIHGQ